LKPHTVVNLAALTDVDLCERDPDKAFADIVHPLDFLRQVQGAYPFRIVQISTDQVYSGGGPHSEASSTRPINAYGRMKLLAEGLLDINRDLIVRTNFIGRSQSQKKKSWTDWLVKSLSSGKEVRIDPRAQFSPLHVHDICHYVSLCISENISGLFNLGSSTSVKKIKFAREFASDLAFDDQLIRELEPAAIVARAPRPLDLRLDSRRFESRMNINLPDVSAVKQRTLKDYIGSSGV
jgi:dTDP-4-dehydrorhamnose reductase